MAMDGIADMGGTEGWGPVHPPRDDEPVFEEPWQGRAFALTLLSIQVSGQNVDAFRHALERLDRVAYLDDGYFGRWLNASELRICSHCVGSGPVHPPGYGAMRDGRVRGRRYRGTKDAGSIRFEYLVRRAPI
jgi:hypothetical protein